MVKSVSQIQGFVNRGQGSGKKPDFIGFFQYNLPENVENTLLSRCGADRTGSERRSDWRCIRQIPSNTLGKFLVERETVIRRKIMEVVKTITVKFKRPDGTIIVLTFTLKVKR